MYLDINFMIKSIFINYIQMNNFKLLLKIIMKLKKKKNQVVKILSIYILYWNFWFKNWKSYIKRMRLNLNKFKDKN